MSLWQKPMSEVTFEDIDAFCSAMYREGTRCDYKLGFPTKLEKTIAAFANTLRRQSKSQGWSASTVVFCGAARPGTISRAITWVLTAP